MSLPINTPGNPLNKRPGEGRKKRKAKVAFTSILAYRELVESGQLKREKELVYRVLVKHGILNSREISIITKKDIGNITRSVNDLKNPKPIPLIEVAEVKPCRITGKTVQHYRVISPKEKGGPNE